MDIQILLAARDPATGDVFRATLEDLGACCTVVESLTDLYRELARRSFHGVLLDMPVTTRATESEKALIHDLLGRIPVLRIYWDEKRREVGSQLYDGSRIVPLKEFLDEYCHPQAPVFVRSDLRLPLHLNVLVASDPEGLGASPERCVTLNVSEGGCFLLTPNEWSGHRTLWIEFSDLVDDDPIEVEICWRIPWGVSKRLSGVGVQFVRLSAAQREEIDALLEEHPLKSQNG